MTHDLIAALCWGVIGSVMVIAAGFSAMVMVAERSDTIGWCAELHRMVTA